VIEFARQKANLPDANSSEFDLHTPDPVIALITEWQNDSGETIVRNADSDLGGTMRLGGQVCLLQPGSLASRIYGGERVIERHRHRFEFNDNYANLLVAAGLVVSARSNDAAGLVEMIELKDHPWFVGCQFHPEYTSNPRDGHPLFTSFVSAALAHRESRVDDAAISAESRGDMTDPLTSNTV